MCMKANFSIRLKELRESKNFSQNQLSQNTKLSQANISRWETGEREPSIKAVILLADFFGVTTDYLLGVTDE